MGWSDPSEIEFGPFPFSQAKEEQMRLEEEKQRMIEAEAKKEKGRHRL